jgi:hypothetical protein
LVFIANGVWLVAWFGFFGFFFSAHGSKRWNDQKKRLRPISAGNSTYLPGLPDFPWHDIPKRGKMCTKWP